MKLISLLLLILFGSCTRADLAKLKVYDYCSHTALDSRALTSLQQEVSDASIPLLSISIIREGKLTSTYLIGCDDSLDSYTDATLFQAGSISKLITSCLALKLSSRSVNPLPLDTLMRSLLTHTAGYNVDGFLGYPHQAPSNAQIIKGTGSNIFNYQPQKIAATSKQFSYSGGGYSIAQDLIERHERKPLQDIARYILLDSLNMRYSTFELTPMSSFVEGSVWGWKFNHWKLPQSAAAGLWTNTAEYAKFLISIYASRQEISPFYTPYAIEQLLRPTKTLDGYLNPYGLGCYVENNVIYHGGRTLGYTSFFEISLETGNGYVLMGNSHDIQKDHILTVLKQHLSL